MAIATASGVGLQARRKLRHATRCDIQRGMTTAPLDDKLIARLKVLLDGCTRTELAARCGLSLSTFMKALGGLPIGATTRRLIALQVGK